MGLQMEPVNNLQVIGQCDTKGLRGVMDQKPVVIPPSVAHAAATPVKDRARCNDHVKQGGVKPVLYDKRWIRFRDSAIPGRELLIRISYPDHLQGLVCTVRSGYCNHLFPAQEVCDEGQGLDLAAEVDINKKSGSLPDLRNAQEQIHDPGGQFFSLPGRKLISSGKNLSSQVVITGLSFHGGC